MTNLMLLLSLAVSIAASDTNTSPQASQTAGYMDILAKEAHARQELLDALRMATTNHQTPVPSSSDSLILKYAEMLKGDAKDHREFLEGLYTKTAAALSGILILLGVVFAWMNWKTRSDIKRQVDDQFRQHAKSLVEEKTAKFSRFLDERTKEIEKQMRGVNSLLLSMASQGAPAREGSSSSEELQKKRVLWVDDYPGNNEYLRTMLEQQGVEFTLALTTEEGMRNLTSTKYDLVISDMGRGPDGQAGLHLLQQMRDKEVNVPAIVFASRGAIAKYGEEAKRLGACYATASGNMLLQGVVELLGQERVGVRTTA